MFIARTIVALIVMLAPLTAATAQSSASGPRSAVATFYKFDGSNPQNFNRRNIDARRRWFSAELNKLLLNELEMEKEFLKANPTDKPHFGDGLPFRPLQETCDLNGKRYRRNITYGRVSVKGNLANVDVHFKYPKGCNLPDILYAVHMSLEKGRWVIDDIRYFPENTSLIEDLNRREY